MQDFALLRHVSIGQYIAGESVVHRLDPRTKLLATLLLTIAIVFATSYLANALLLLACLAMLAASGISFRYVWGTIRPALPVLAFFAVLQLVFSPAGFGADSAPAIWLQWGPLQVSSAGVQVVVISAARFLDLMILAILLTGSTPLGQLARGMEDLLHPFRRLGVPAHEIAMVGTIALRFIPILAEQMETIMKAQASRGADVSGGSRLHFIRTARATLVILVPIFLEAFRRAEDLVVAMQARCYAGGAGRTRLRRSAMRPADYGVVGATVVVVVALIAFGGYLPF